MKMIQTNSKPENIDFQLDSGGLENSVEIELNNYETIVYKAKVYDLDLNAEGLIGKVSLEKSLKQVYIETSGFRNKKQTPKNNSYLLWRVETNKNERVNLTNKDQAILLNEDGLVAPIKNYKVYLVKQCLTFDPNPLTLDVSSKPIIMPYNLIDSILEPIDKELVRIYNLMLKK